MDAGPSCTDDRTTQVMGQTPRDGVPAKSLTRSDWSQSPASVPFHLSRWFAVVGFVSIALTSSLAAILLDRFLTDRLLHQEAVLTAEFVQSVVLVEKSLMAYFSGVRDVSTEELQSALQHIASVPDAVRANVYNRDRQVIWSSDKLLVGQRFGVNDELDEALNGDLVVHVDEHHKQRPDKQEHLHLGVDFFVEIYLPVRDAGGQHVIGVVELYKNPLALFQAIRTGRLYIFIGAAVAGLFLYLALFGLARRADGVIRAQQERLVENETLAAVGEMGSAVAHGIRNPLAVIRTSAELVLESDPSLAREAAEDIIAESDRLNEWVTELLSYSRPLRGAVDPVAVRPIIERTAIAFARDMERRRIECRLHFPKEMPLVRGDPLLLEQVLHSLIANAIEAIGNDGKIDIELALDTGGIVRLTLRDDGPGMDAEQMSHIFKPFYTTKAKGLGVGLSLAKRIVERYGGRIEVASAPNEGCRISVLLPIASNSE